MAANQALRGVQRSREAGFSVDRPLSGIAAVFKVSLDKLGKFCHNLICLPIHGRITIAEPSQV